MQLYSLYHRDAAVRRGSSSGGAFTCITDSVFALHDRVAIWGCTLNAEQRAVHTRATDRAGRDAMRGSKYVASSGLGDAFRGVRRDLEDGYFVVFSGTPCQVSGLLSFLRAVGVETESLLTIDFVCHGVGSNAFFEDYLRDMERRCKSRVVQCRFRAHAQPGKKQDMELLFENGRAYHAPSTRHDWFYSVYLKNLVLRPACYTCKFESAAGESDITLADDWSVRDRDMSLLLLRTPSAEALLPYMREAADLREKEAAQEIPNLHRPTPRPAAYDAFWEAYRTGGYLAAQRMVGNHTFAGRLRFRLAVWADRLHIRQWIKRVKRK